MSRIGLGCRHRAARRRELALFSYPLLVDEGRLSERADELKAALGEQAFVEVHPEDARQLRPRRTATAVVRTAAGEAELPLRVTTPVAAGSAFVPYNQPGLAGQHAAVGAFHAAARSRPPARSDADEAAATVGSEA